MDRLEETLISEEEEEEEEDVDFNPLLKETPSREASSSLSSDVETLDAEPVNSIITQSLSNGVREEEAKEEIAVVQAESIPKVSPPQGSKEEEEEDDAICKRTRARYSLESFTLDDLEAFLQETDDEDDIPNVDDQEEYRKFLAAVLHSGDAPEVHSVHDDDEDNDLDFEIELEEALETDDDEPIPEKATADDVTKQRRVTRQKRKQNISRIDDSPEQQAARLLRPILPVVQPVRMLLPAAPESLAVNSKGIGFTQSQIGELHCLIQDHLQLLIQVYSLCALDYSRQQIGAQVQGLISEMIQQHQGYVSRRSHLLVSGSASSVLNTVNLAGRYLADVSTAVQDYRRCQVESGFDALSQRVPLFPLPLQHISSPPSMSLSHQQQSKKSLAATIVESAKKESVALVHKDIAKLAKTFLPLFKVSLYPHKPPAAAVSNRFLFTDAEDELLALGIMEYNSDWKAIKQRFLPCKGEHQIHIRQKNRRSSKAPDNPIKAVLRMKSSPLTPQEIERIEEGLRYFKFDWISVWKFIVPYRDPSTLPRQWRTALGEKYHKKRKKNHLFSMFSLGMRTEIENLWVFALASKCNIFIQEHFISLLIAVAITWFTLTIVFWSTPGGPAWGRYFFTRRFTSGCNQKNKNIIPGPRGFPLVGSMSLRSSRVAHQRIAAVAAMRNAKRLMAFSLGDTKVMVTCHPDVAKEILNSSVFADRPVDETAYGLMFNRAMGFAPSGAYWRTLRRLGSNHLFNPKQIKRSEEQRRVIATQMVNVFARNAETAFGVRDLLKTASLSNMMGLVFGKQYELESNNNVESECLKGLVEEGYDLLGTLNWTDHLPWLAGLDFQQVRFRCSQLVPKVNQLLSRIIHEHRALTCSFLDVLQHSLHDSEKLSESDMVAVLWEMIFRGTDTVAVLIEWVLARIVMHPKVQSTVHDELDRVVGRSKAVDESDLPSLTYLTAMIKEVLRLHPPGPLLSWARLSITDTTVDGYHVPAGTTAMVNMWAIARDPHVWENPLEFKPERFVAKEGEAEFSVLGSDLRLAPFGSGKRVCPGKNLGLATVSFWVATLLHEFEWLSSVNANPPDLSEVLRLSCEMACPLVVNLRSRRKIA